MCNGCVSLKIPKRWVLCSPTYSEWHYMRLKSNQIQYLLYSKYLLKHNIVPECYYIEMWHFLLLALLFYMTTSMFYTWIIYIHQSVIIVQHTIHIFISVISDTGYIVAYNAITEFVTMHSEKQFGKTHCLNFVVQPREREKKTAKKL